MSICTNTLLLEENTKMTNTLKLNLIREETNCISDRLKVKGLKGLISRSTGGHL